MANNPKSTKKEVPEIEGVPSGTPFSHLTPEGLREEYARVHGVRPEPDMTFQAMIDALIFQFELQKTLAFQDETYAELNGVAELPND